ncbi:MAG: hypothetical protein ACRD2L_22240 [Terriglobia bacterium]
MAITHKFVAHPAPDPTYSFKPAYVEELEKKLAESQQKVEGVLVSYREHKAETSAETQAPPWHGSCGQLALQMLTAFEMKLIDWRKGLAQAYCYSHFADVAIVVLPPDAAKTAEAELQLFRELSGGLWSFDMITGELLHPFWNC